MKRLVILLVCLSCCGTEEAPEEEVLWVPPEQCLNCDSDYDPSEEIVIPEPRPRAYLTPTELLFYFSSNTEMPYPPGYISVVNKTEEDVLVLDAFIMEDEDCYICGSPSYFTLTPPELPHLLGPEETLLLEITFSFSTAQQGAVLEVHTSFEPDTVLQATMSGKVFIF